MPTVPGCRQLLATRGCPAAKATAVIEETPQEWPAEEASSWLAVVSTCQFEKSPSRAGKDLRAIPSVRDGQRPTSGFDRKGVGTSRERADG